MDWGGIKDALPGLYLHHDDKKPKWKKEPSDDKVIDLTLQEMLPVYSPMPPPKQKITAKNYAAVQIDGKFGILDCGTGSFNEQNLILHSTAVDKSAMLGVQPGQKIDFKYVGSRQKGEMVVRYVTRSKYYSPGRPVTSVMVGVDGWDKAMVVGR